MAGLLIVYVTKGGQARVALREAPLRRGKKE